MSESPKILIVDDDPKNLSLLEAHLTPRGYEVLKAGDGNEALKVINTTAVDLLLLDVMMPGIDGFEVTRRIRSDAKTRSIPIVLITALSDTTFRIKGIEAGCDDFISKPFDKGEVLARVKMLLEMASYRSKIQEMNEALTAWATLLEEKNLELKEMQIKLVQQEKMALLGRVSAALSHELRTPLTGIKNSTYLLQVLGIEKQDPKVSQSIAIINVEVDACERVINNMMNFVIPMKPIKKETKPDMLLEQLISEMVVPSNITIKMDVQKDLPFVPLDFFQIKQVFGNIVKNAIEAMYLGGELFITVRSDGDYIAIEFMDTGIGISEKNLARIFEPLFSTTPTGIGLGLTIARQIVEAHGGTIEATSWLDKGSTFRIKLPIK